MGYILVMVLLALAGVAIISVDAKPITITQNHGRDVTIAPPAKGTSLLYVVAAMALWSLWCAVYQISAGHVGVVYRFGSIVGQTVEGLQFVPPWESVREASNQILKNKFEKMTSFSSETQDVYVDATVNTQVSPTHVQKLYRDVGPNYFEVLVRPRVNQAFKDETVKYKSVDIAPKREIIRVAVRERLTKELEAYSIRVDDLLVDNIDFDPKFKAAIAEKQVQTQLALAEKEKVAAEQNRALQAVAKAEGEGRSILVLAEKQADANRKLAESITPALIQYQTVQKLAPNVSVMMVPANANLLMTPDLLKPTGGQQAQR
jgi:regulator of protease activity HflC (stomatin/prohibitin superfamily)